MSLHARQDRAGLACTFGRAMNSLAIDSLELPRLTFEVAGSAIRVVSVASCQLQVACCWQLCKCFAVTHTHTRAHTPLFSQPLELCNTWPQTCGKLQWQPQPEMMATRWRRCCNRVWCVCGANTNATRRLKSRAHAPQMGVCAWQLQ